MSEFKREGRYIVVKPDCEDSLRTERLRNYIDEMCFKTPDCVVVEADWPEYEPVWRMIELRVTGASADAKPVEVLGYSVVGNPYAIRLTKGEVLELSENYADHLIELVDRKHLTDAQVELASLREELAGSNRRLGACINQIEEQQQRLAAAEQRNAEQLSLLHMSKELLSMISLHRTMAPNDWCDSFKKEVADRLEKLRAVLANPTESGASE
ncbi:hypothetical protein [Pseudomonas gorinensis]